MCVDLLGQANEFAKKVAGRIPVETFAKQTYDIIRMVRDFMLSRDLYNLGAGSQRKIGKISLDLHGKTLDVDIVVVNDKHLSFNAGMDWATKPPKLVINLYSFQYYDPLFIDDKLKPIIQHELTHVIDNAYNPVYSVSLDQTELKSDFIKSYKELLLRYGSNIDYGDISSFKNYSIESIARNNVLRLLKTRAFKNLAAQYNITTDRTMIAKLFRIAYDLYLEDMNLYRDTGGFLLAPPRSKEEKQQHKQVKDVATKIYFNSESEIKAYINQITAEIRDYLIHGDKHNTIIRIMRGQDSVSNNIQRLLEQSKTFQENKDEWTSASMKRIYKEVANFLTKETKKLSLHERAEAYGITLDAKQMLVYRYLQKLLSTNPDKLHNLIKDKQFKKNNDGALRLLLKDLEFQQHLKALKDSMPSFMKEKQ